MSSRWVRLREALDARRLQAAARYFVAAAWSLSVLALLLGGGKRTLFGVAAGLFLVAFLRWPTVLRWPLTALPLTFALGATAFTHGYFHALINYSLIAWMGLATLGHVLLLFWGPLTLARLAAGVALIIAPHFGFSVKQQLESRFGVGL